MGYASHKIGYTGYAPTDDKLQEDTTVYTEATAADVTKITGYALTDVQNKSKLRFKLEGKTDQAGGAWHVKVYIGGDLIWLTQHTGNVYQAKTADILVSWRREDLIDVKLSNQTGPLAGLAYLKNFEICGKISPVRLD